MAAVTAGGGLTGGGTVGAVTLDVGAGNGIAVNANDIAVLFENQSIQDSASILQSNEELAFEL